jgi:hypothetical protein
MKQAGIELSRVEKRVLIRTLSGPLPGFFLDVLS